MDLMTMAQLGVAGVAGAAALRASMAMYDEVFDRWVQLQSRRLAFAERRQQLRQAQSEHERKLKVEAVKLLRPDEHGRLGVAYDGQSYRNLDTLAAFDQVRTVYIDPMMERISLLQKVLLALPNLPQGMAEQVLELNAPGAVSEWPNVVGLESLFVDRRPSIHNLVIGVRPGQNGLDTVSLSLHDLMHTLTVGASGWGKSTWLRALLWQIARASEPVEIAAIDIAGSEFNVLRNWGKLRYPVARSVGEAKAVLDQVSVEIERRKTLFEQHPLATKLDEYNQASGADLPPWLVAIDEGTHLLNQRGLAEPLRAAVQTARQYGVYILVAGQSAKHSVIDTQVRDNFSSRLAFRTSPTSSRVVLDDSAASDITVKGRMQAQLVGKPLMELQGPFVGREAFLAALSNGGPKNPLPDEKLSQDELIRKLANEGFKQYEIEDEVFGYTGGAAHRKVKAILDDYYGNPPFEG